MITSSVTIFSTPTVLHSVGFTTGGVAKGTFHSTSKGCTRLSPGIFYYPGSVAAWTQSFLYGASVPAGSPFAVAQSIGAAGLGTAATAVGGTLLVTGAVCVLVSLICR